MRARDRVGVRVRVRAALALPWRSICSSSAAAPSTRSLNSASHASFSALLRGGMRVTVGVGVGVRIWG